MGRRRAPGPETLGRTLIRQKTQRSRNHRHSDSWVKQSLPCFSAFLCSYESLNAAKPGVKSHRKNCVGKVTPNEGLEEEYV